MSVAPELIAAYEKAEYAAGPVVLKVGEANAALEALLQKHEVATAAFVTASNPGSERLPDLQNAARSAVLEQSIRKTGRFYLQGAGRDPGRQWPPEPSYLILGIPLEEAEELGRAFGQNAIVFVERGQAPRLAILK